MALAFTLTISGSPRVGDVGHVITIDVGESIDDRETFEMLFRKPDGSRTTETAAGAGQVLSFTTGAGFFDQDGVWEVQARVVDITPDPDKEEKSPIGSFYVGPAL